MHFLNPQMVGFGGQACRCEGCPQVSEQAAGRPQESSPPRTPGQTLLINGHSPYPRAGASPGALSQGPAPWGTRKELRAIAGHSHGVSQLTGPCRSSSRCHMPPRLPLTRPPARAQPLKGVESRSCRSRPGTALRVGAPAESGDRKVPRHGCRREREPMSKTGRRNQGGGGGGGLEGM